MDEAPLISRLSVILVLIFTVFFCDTMNTWKFAFQREKIYSLYGILKRIEVILLAREKTFNYLFCLCFKISFCRANNITQRVKMLAMEA